MRSSSFFFLAPLAVAACSSGGTDPAPSSAAPTTQDAPAPDDAGSSGAPAKEDAAAPPPAKGCTVTPAGTGTMTKRTTSVAGTPRTYHLSVPSDLVAKRAVPLVFVLHGAGDTSPENMRDWFGVEARMPGALFVYPQALPRTRSDGSGGNVPRWDVTGEDDLRFFDAMLAEIGDAYCVDRARVLVTGFSSGGNFSQQLACLRQKDVKGMAVVAGPGPFVSKCGGPVPVWMTHDAEDQALPVKDARSSRDFWAKQNGCGAAWSAVDGRPECQRNTSCPAGGPVVYCETKGVGHDVPAFAVPAIAQFFASLAK